MSKQQATRDNHERFTYKDDEAIEKPFNWAQLSRLFSYMKPYRRKLLPVLIVMMILGTVTRLAIPAIIIVAIDEAIQPKNGGDPNLSKLYLYAGLMLAVYIIQWAANTFRIRYTNIIGQHVIYDLRQDLFRHIQKLSFRFFDKRPAGSVLVRVTNDVNALAGSIHQWCCQLADGLCPAGRYRYYFASLNFKLGLAVMITVPLMFIVSTALRRRIRFAWQDVRMKQSRINAHLNESIQGMRVTQAYTQEKANFSFLQSHQQ